MFRVKSNDGYSKDGLMFRQMDRYIKKQTVLVQTAIAKIPQTGWLTLQKFISPGCGGWGLQDQDASVPGRQTLPCHVLTQQEKEKTISLMSLHIRALIPFMRASIAHDLITFQRPQIPPALQMASLRIRALTYEFWEDVYIQSIVQMEQNITIEESRYNFSYKMLGRKNGLGQFSWVRRVKIKQEPQSQIGVLCVCF